MPHWLIFKIYYLIHYVHIIWVGSPNASTHISNKFIHDKEDDFSE